VFRACVACHGLTPRDTNLAGPTLNGIMGRRIASQPGYAYSAPFAKLDIIWTPETIARLFEVGPAKFTPGTKMPEQRITDPDDRRALVDWLARVTVP
jgi:cytochrome c